MVKDAKGFSQPQKQSTDVAGWTNDAVVNAAARSALTTQTAPADEPPSAQNGSNGASQDPPEEPEEEEIDLVEQLYGPGMSLRDEPINLTESLVLPAAPKNKDLDIAAWGRSPSLPTTPQPNAAHTYSQSFGSSPGPTPRSTSFGHARVTSSPPTSVPIRQSTAGLSSSSNGRPPLSLEEYSERMRTAAVMLAQLNATLTSQPNAVNQPAPPPNMAENGESSPSPAGAWSWLPGTGWIRGTVDGATSRTPLQRAEAESIRSRIMQEMMTLEEERMERMKGGDAVTSGMGTSLSKAEDEGIIRRELNKLDPSGAYHAISPPPIPLTRPVATVFRENFSSKKARIKSNSPYGHLANWDVVSVIVKTGADLRQEQLALILIQVICTVNREDHLFLTCASRNLTTSGERKSAGAGYARSSVSFKVMLCLVLTSFLES